MAASNKSLRHETRQVFRTDARQVTQGKNFSFDFITTKQANTQWRLWRSGVTGPVLGALRMIPTALL